MISLQNDVLASVGVEKVHDGPEVIEIRDFFPPNHKRAFFFVTHVGSRYRGLQREENQNPVRVLPQHFLVLCCKKFFMITLLTTHALYLYDHLRLSSIDTPCDSL